MIAPFARIACVALRVLDGSVARVDGAARVVHSLCVALGVRCVVLVVVHVGVAAISCHIFVHYVCLSMRVHVVLVVTDNRGFMLPTLLVLFLLPTLPVLIVLPISPM